jgi:secondary thiamine-phosphate synthase enzyme
VSKLSGVRSARIDTLATAVLTVATPGTGFFEITRDLVQFLDQIKARDGAVLLYLKHTSASLVIQENADADVRTDLVTALDRLAPAQAGWVHDVEGPDDMPAHIKSMLNGVSLHVPVIDGALALVTWQGIYVAEHRARSRGDFAISRRLSMSGEPDQKNGRVGEDPAASFAQNCVAQAAVNSASTSFLPVRGGIRAGRRGRRRTDGSVPRGRANSRGRIPPQP